MKISFDDCPNKCVEGKLFNPYTHSYSECPYCAEKRKQICLSEAEVPNKENLQKELRLPSCIFISNKYNFDEVLPKCFQTDLVADSVSNVDKSLHDLLSRVSSGSAPDRSYLFNLGKRSYAFNYISLLLERAYMAGIKTAPYLTSDDITYIQQAKYGDAKAEAILDSEGLLDYNELLDKDLVVIHILADLTDINLIKGVVQARGLRCKPTVIFTETLRLVYNLVGSADESSFVLCQLCEIEYAKKDESDTPRKPGVKSSVSMPSNMGIDMSKLL